MNNLSAARVQRSIIEPEPLPTTGVACVHDRLRHEYGDVYPEIVGDLWAKALQTFRSGKYKLDRPGLYTFNGRNAIKEVYQEVADAIVYLEQCKMEREASGLPPDPITDEIAYLFNLAQRLRDRLEAEGVIE